MSEHGGGKGAPPTRSGEHNSRALLIVHLYSRYGGHSPQIHIGFGASQLVGINCVGPVAQVLKFPPSPSIPPQISTKKLQDM